MKNFIIIFLALFIAVEHYEAIVIAGFRTYHTFAKPDHEPKFKVGQCISPFYISESTNGITDRMIDIPSGKALNDLSYEIKSLSGNGRVYEVRRTGKMPVNDSIEVEYGDRRYVRVNCDGKYP